MQELEITWPRVLSVWWLFAWRGFIGAFLISLVVGFIIGLVGRLLLGYPQEQTALLAGLAGALVGIAWSLVVMRMALKNVYSEFRVMLVPNAQAVPVGARTPRF